MVISTGNLIAINKVLEDILSVIGYELRDCKKIEFEIKSNKINKEILEDICFEIWLNSNCNGNEKCNIEYYISNDLGDDMCEYSIKLYGVKTPPQFIKKVKYYFYNY
jgi:hypothetical protein